MANYWVPLSTSAMALADSRIQTAVPGIRLGTGDDADAYYCSHYRCSSAGGLSDIVLDGSRNLWETSFRTSTIGDDLLLSILATVSNVWGANTADNLDDRAGVINTHAGLGSKYHLPLLSRFLYGGTLDDFYFNEATYEALLNGGQCYSSHGGDIESPYDFWSNPGGTLIYGLNTSSVSTETNHIGYLFYFNLYNLYKTNYLTASGANYVKIDPSKLCELDINKTGFKYNINQDDQTILIPFVESDKKGFHAANSINVSGGGDGTPYVIQNDGDAQPWPLSQANITYEAGNEVNLHAGFEVHEGAEFHAYINPNLEAMSCSGTRAMFQPPNNSNAGVIELSDEELTSTYEHFLNQNIAEKNSTLVSPSSLLTIAPNPNSGSFQVSISNDGYSGIRELKIYDLMGKVIWERGASTSNLFMVDISNYAGGIYYLKCIVNSGESITEKLVKH